MIIVNDFQPITIITKHSIFDVASVLNPPLIRQNYLLQGKENTSKQGKICHFEVSLQVSLQLFSKSHYSETSEYGFDQRQVVYRTYALREKCPFSALFWCAFSCIQTEYGEILYISPYSVHMRENADQNNSEYGHFLRSDVDGVLA